MDKNEVITLEDRGFIQVKGVEAKDFLQNIVTNNIEKAKNNSTVFSSILTPQGKYLFEFFIDKSVVLGVPSSLGLNILIFCWRANSPYLNQSGNC